MENIIKEEQDKRDNLYKKSNFLISVKWESSLLENKIMAIALSKISDIKIDSKSNKMYSQIKASEIRALLEGNKGSFYDQLEDTAKLMTGRVIGAKDPEKKTFTYLSIITMADYRDGVFTIEWNDHLKNHLIGLENNFTLLNLNLMAKFKSTWSFRLYEILRSKSFNYKNEDQDNRHFEFDYYLSELKFEMGVANANIPQIRRYLDKKEVTKDDFDEALKIAIRSGACSYVEWKDFRRYVLDMAVKEINESPLSEIKIQYIPQGSGRGGKISAIHFITDIQKKNQKEEKTEELVEISEDDIFDEAFDILSKDFKAKEVREIIRTAEYDVEKIKKAYSVLSSQKTDIDNKMGFMIKAIQEGYEPPKKKRGKNTFNDFPQREYDFDKIEEMILGN